MVAKISSCKTMTCIHICVITQWWSGGGVWYHCLTSLTINCHNCFHCILCPHDMNMSNITWSLCPVSRISYHSQEYSSVSELPGQWSVWEEESQWWPQYQHVQLQVSQGLSGAQCRVVSGEQRGPASPDWPLPAHHGVCLLEIRKNWRHRHLRSLLQVRF